MKIRLYQNSIRLRLSSESLELLDRENHVDTQLNFPDNKFLIMELKIGDNYSCQYGNDKIVIQLESAATRSWLGTEGTSISHIFKLDNNLEMSILVEKDFLK